MVALDALEQLDADAFELIAADARGRRVADRVEIAVEEAIGERAHGQVRRIDVLEQHRRRRAPPPPPNAARGSGRAAPRAARARRRGRRPWRSAGRRAPASGRRRARAARAARLQPRCAFSRASSAATSPGSLEPGARLDRALVDVGRPDLDRNAGGLEQCAARRALGGEHQRLRGEPERHVTPVTCRRRRSASSVSTAAAVSSIERRVTSMIGQLCRAQSLRAKAISSATAWRSTY